MNTRRALLLAAAALPSLAAAQGDVTARLAAELAAEGNPGAAAIEYRRLAAAEAEPERQAGYYWAAAWMYQQGAEFGLVEKMLDRAELGDEALAAKSLLLRAEANRGLRQFDAAAFSLEALLSRPPASADEKNFAGLRLASLRAAAGDTAGARAALDARPSPAPRQALAALAAYEAGHDKAPWLGGLLGLIPGLGYAYSGEYATGLRSLILNGLFIFAMADTAHDEEWGAFAAVTFFELTWYSGSIYGGVDAAHRYNRDRLAACREGLDGAATMDLELPAVPVVTLRFRF